MKINVKTGGRLHFGFADLSGDLGRLYGSTGVALESPNTLITFRKSSHFSIERGNKKRILDFVRKFSDRYSIDPNVIISVEKSISEHTGLGSGTQLALAISTALARLYNIKTNVRELSTVMERGRRSGVGVACFETGGFILDSGRKNPGSDNESLPPRVIFRHDFPEKWAFVIVIPETAPGLSGEEESKALKHLSPSKKTSEEVCRLIQIKLLPSLVEENIEEFGSVLTEIDRKTGMCFEKVQGGIYRWKMAKEIIEHMVRLGAYGAGQSSWGPALYGLVDDKNSMVVADHMKDFLAKNEMKGGVLVSHANNEGARITISEE